MYVIAGLGNPGLSYRKTRHNIGFMALDVIAQRMGVKIKDKKFSGLLGEGELNGERVILVKPQTYMNLSGDCLQQVMHFYKLPPERLIVLCDDVDLPCGSLRIRAKGSAGTHNGLKSIIACRGTEDFPRIRLGVGAPPHPDYDMADWVLSALKNQDAQALAEAAGRAAEAVECYIAEGPDRAMNRFN